MTKIVMGKRISQAVLLILLGITLAALSHSTVEAATSDNKESSRRLPAPKIRGLQHDIGSDRVGKVERVNVRNKGEDKTGRNKLNLSGVSRPTPQNFGKITLNINAAREAARPTKKLPEHQQASNIEVNKSSGSNPKIGGLSAALKGNDLNGIGKNSIKSAEVETGMEHFQEVEVEVYRREIPSFSIKFEVAESSSDNLPNLADYNELSDVSEEYLDNFFRSVFEDVPVRHDGTALFVMVSEDDSYTVDFRMTLEFIIPGEVPTINFLIDRLQDGFEKDTSQAFFISDLSLMSATNPFSKTVSYQVVSRPPVSAAEMGRGGGKQPQVGDSEHVGKNSVLISLLAGMGCLVLIGAGLLWRKKNSIESAASGSNQTFSLFDKTNNKSTSTSSRTSGVYGADEETMNYLNSIRKRYRDHDGSKKSSSSASNDNNIAAVEQTGSYDDGEDSMCDTVDTGSDNEKKNMNGVEDVLRSIY